jgi:hypothetical protein
MKHNTLYLHKNKHFFILWVHKTIFTTLLFLLCVSIPFSECKMVKKVTEVLYTSILTIIILDHQFITPNMCTEYQTLIMYQNDVKISFSQYLVFVIMFVVTHTRLEHALPYFVL